MYTGGRGLSGEGGSLSLTGGDTGGTTGGSVSIRSGMGTSNDGSGAIRVASEDANEAYDSGTLKVMTGEASSGDTGDITMRTGTVVDGDSGTAVVYVGDSAEGDGGGISATAGRTFDEGELGGAVSLLGGDATHEASGTGGEVFLNAGYGL